MTKPTDLRELRDTMTAALLAMKRARTPAPATRAEHPLCTVDRGPTPEQVRAQEKAAATELAARRKREAAERQAQKNKKRLERDARAALGRSASLVTKAPEADRDRTPQNGVTPDEPAQTGARDTAALA